MADYCTEQQARDAGAVGTTAEVLAAIGAAGATIERYTGDVFAPSSGSVVCDVGTNGVALLRRRVQTVTAVRSIGGSITFPAASYLVTSSEKPGDIDSIVFGGQGMYDPLVAGAEPWNGGYVGLVQTAAGARVEVEGTFGWDAPPAEVTRAAAILAAMATSEAATAREGGDVATDDEGNVVSITVGGKDPATGEAATYTTGNANVDAMLAPFVRSRVRLA